MFSSAILPIGIGHTTVTTVVNRLVADMPQLLLILGGLFAASVILHLFKSFVHSSGISTPGRIGGSDRAYNKLVRENKETIAAFDKEYRRYKRLTGD